MDLAFTLDLVLIALLVATIAYAMVLHRRLGALRSDRADLETFLERMSQATAKADASLKGIRETAERAQQTLHDPLNKAQAMRDELLFLIERADSSAERVANGVQKSAAPSPPPAEPTADAERPAPAKRARPRARPAAAPQPDSSDDPQDGARSQAERDLMNALRNVR